VPLYFFHTIDNDTYIEDDQGVELFDLEAVKVQAARSLAELARDVLPGSIRRDLAVEVRDERQSVLKATLVFEAIILIS
jgi:homoserine acetyltransferase